MAGRVARSRDRLMSLGRCNPRLPLRLGEAYGNLLAETHHRLRQQERILRELCEPTVVAHARMLQSEIEITRRFLVDERSHSELLSESPQFSQRGCALVQVHEVNLHSSFGKEPLRLARVGTLLRAEDLHFHVL